MRSDGGIDEVAPQPAQPRKRPLLVGTSKLAVSDYIRRKNGCEFSGLSHPKVNTVGRLREQRQRWRVPGQILPAQRPFNVTPMEYKGYQVEVSRGRASIFSPDSKRPLPDCPSNLEKSKAEELVAEAKRIIDERLNRQPS